jgi:hypothetical protein
MSTTGKNRIMIFGPKDDGTYVVEFPRCRIEDYWIHAETKVRVAVRPTHWREWSEQ